MLQGWIESIVAHIVSKSDSRVTSYRQSELVGKESQPDECRLSMSLPNTHARLNNNINP